MNQTKGKILVVDDERLILIGIKALFKDAGYYVQTAATPQQAIAIAEKEVFDIAYVDLIMPQMNGVEVCRRIKQISPATQVVLMSGHPEEIENKKHDFYQAGGMKKIINKPFDFEEMIAIANKVARKIKEK
ncbi:MAG: response regulator [Candidatus Omnitrophota bacterium]